MTDNITQYLYKKFKPNEPFCPYCPNITNTLKHLVDCPVLISNFNKIVEKENKLREEQLKHQEEVVLQCDKLKRMKDAHTLIICTKQQGKTILTYHYLVNRAYITNYFIVYFEKIMDNILLGYFKESEECIKINGVVQPPKKLSALLDCLKPYDLKEYILPVTIHQIHYITINLDYDDDPY